MKLTAGVLLLSSPITIQLIDGGLGHVNAVHAALDGPGGSFEIGTGTAGLDASSDSGRRVRILEMLGQPPDHPVPLEAPECEYLKGLICVVD